MLSNRAYKFARNAILILWFPIMVRSSWYIFFMVIGGALCFVIKPYKVTLVSSAYWPENGVWDASKVRLIGRDRMFNGTVTLREDMDEEHYSFSGESYSDPTGDGNFKLLPFHIPRTSICQAYHKYRSYFSQHAEYGRQTDFPMNRDVCPIPKGTYFLKNIKISTENWPAILPRGFLRANGTFYRNNEHIGTYSVTGLIEDRDSE